MPQLSGDAPILATKLFVPSPRENVVSRARLHDRLDERGGRVTLVAASAGSGKSTLLAGWALEARGRIAWLSLDEADDEPRRFLNYVIAAMRTAEAIGADDVLDALASKPEALQNTATELLNAIATRGAPVTLVLDDYHAISSRAVHDVLQFLIDHLAPNLHVAIATRADPPLALSRLRARGLLLELRGSDLRFTADEAGAFLNTAMGLSLANDEIAELEQRTEGWAVGLQMAAISLSGSHGAGAFIRKFSGSNRYVLDYLTDEVLDRQPAEVRQFLLATSILTRLHPALCDAVLEAGNSEEILHQLDAANLFLIPLDDVRTWYRYHHLFATLLQHHLTRAQDAAAIAVIHRRASSWYETNGMPESAFEHALAANDIERAASIVSTQSLVRMFGGDTTSVVRWFDRLPKERIENDVELLLRQGMALMGDWQLPRAHACTVRATELTERPEFAGRRGPAMGMRGALEKALGRLAEGDEWLRRAVPLVEEEPFWYSLVHYFLGLTCLMEADAGVVATTFERVRERHSRPQEIMPAVLAQMFTAFAAWWRGEPDAAVALANESFAWIDVTQHLNEGRPLDALPLAVLATVYCSWNELDRAREYADRAAEHGRRGVMLGLFESSRTLARVALAAGDWDTAVRAGEDAMRSVRNTGSNQIWSTDAAAIVNTIHFRRWQTFGDRTDLSAVETWLRAANVVERLRPWESRRIAGFHCDASLLLAARVMVENGNFDEASTLLDDIMPAAQRTQRVLAQIENLVVRALLEARRGRLDHATDATSRALKLAAPARAIRLFLDEGPAIQPLVERAAATFPDRDFAQRILASFAAPAARPAPARPSAPDALSEREVEVLRLVASGASNQEAGRKLFIAPSTVKKHLENIYAKLGVGGRVEAVGRAREIGLLP